MAGVLTVSLGGCALPRIEAAVVDFQKAIDPLPKSTSTSSTSAQPGASAAPGAPAAGAPAAPVDPATVTAAQLAKNTEAAVKAVKSVHIVVASTTNGQNSSLDFAGRADATEFSLSFSVGGQTASMVKVDGACYVKGNSAFWKGTKQPNVSQLADKWVLLNSAGAKSISDSLMVDKMTDVSSYFRDADLGTVTAGTLDGAAVLIFTQGRASSSSQRVFVDPTTWRLVKVEEKQGTITYTQWNAVPKPARPTGQIINA